MSFIASLAFDKWFLLLRTQQMVVTFPTLAGQSIAILTEVLPKAIEAKSFFSNFIVLFCNGQLCEDFAFCCSMPLSVDNTYSCS